MAGGVTSTAGFMTDLNICEGDIGRAKFKIGRGASNFTAAAADLLDVINNLTTLRTTLLAASLQSDLATEPTLTDPLLDPR